MSTHKMGIYIWTNHTGKVYVGSSVDMPRRRLQHLSNLRRGKHNNRYLQRAWNKYGEAAFCWAILQLVQDVVDLVAVEESWIQRLQATDPAFGYNTGPADAPRRGARHTEASKRLVSQAMRGRKLSEQHKRKISESMKGKQNCLGYKRSEETKRKIGEASRARGNGCLRRPRTEETRRRISAATRGRVLSPEFRERISQAVTAWWARRRLAVAGQSLPEAG